MNEQPGMSLPDEVAELKAEVISLRRTANVMLAAMLVLTLALNAVFFWQCRAVRRQLSTARMEWAQYQRTAVPVVDEFLTRLQAFAGVHPDFIPILGKYAPARTNAVPASMLVPR